jgi:glycerophosphoryl diester phosphodiesterase
MKFILALLFISSSIMAQIPFIQGHRGCRGLYPENSLPAFEHALNLGCLLYTSDAADEC